MKKFNVENIIISINYGTFHKLNDYVVYLKLFNNKLLVNDSYICECSGLDSCSCNNNIESLNIKLDNTINIDYDPEIGVLHINDKYFNVNKKYLNEFNVLIDSFTKEIIEVRTEMKDNYEILYYNNILLKYHTNYYKIFFIYTDKAVYLSDNRYGVYKPIKYFQPFNGIVLSFNNDEIYYNGDYIGSFKMNDIRFEINDNKDLVNIHFTNVDNIKVPYDVNVSYVSSPNDNEFVKTSYNEYMYEAFDTKVITSDDFIIDFKFT